MTADPGSLLPVALQAVAVASDLMRTRRPATLIEKSDRDLVSDVDLAIERAIRDQLKAASPEISFLGEEEGRTGNADAAWLWTFDPIDGTSNFAHGLPMCATSLALLHNGRAVLAVIDTPFLGQRYHAIDGQGAYTGSTRLAVSTTTELRDAVVAIGDYAVGEDADRRNELRLALTMQLARRVHRIRMLGTAAVDLAWVAEGRLDASITLANKPWDTAPGALIAREAGARVVDKNGTTHGLHSAATIAAPPALIEQIVPLIQSVDSDYRPATATTPPYAALDDILSRTRCLILDFDSVICDLFAGTTPTTVARKLRDALGAQFAESLPALAETTDPFEILARAANVSPVLYARAEAAMTELETSAVATAQPAAYVHEVIAACRDSGRTVAVISRHSSDAVTSYLTTHGLADQISHVAARTGQNQAISQLIDNAISASGNTSAECVLVTESAEGVGAAADVGAHTIGHAVSIGARGRLTSTCNAVITSLSDLTLRLRARGRGWFREIRRARSSEEEVHRPEAAS